MSKVVLPPSDLISIFAATIALISLGVSVYELAENRPKLRIRISTGVSLPPLNHVLVVNISNYGRQPTSISGIEFQSSDFVDGNGNPLNVIPFQVRIVGDQMPFVLEVGRVASIVYDLNVELDGFACGSFREFVTRGDFVGYINSSWHKQPVRARFSGAATKIL